MKNTLNYYYGLEISNIHQKNNNYYFNLNNYDYIFIKVDSTDISEIYDLSIQLNQMGVPSHIIILNKENNILTKINNDNYVLLKVQVNKSKINLNEIINFNNINIPIKNSKKLDWFHLWTNKIDYLEYQINQIGKKYPLLTESFGYYSGLAENAIALIKTIDTSKLPIALCHRRVLNSYTTYDLYNPLEFIIDSRIRDVCEYFKNDFFNGDVIQISSYLNYNNLNYEESVAFLARMMFPTYYFDMYEKIINNEIDEIKLNYILKKTNEYERLLASIYNYFKFKNNIQEIEWLKKII